MEWDYLHEAEEVFLRSPKRRDYQEVADALSKAGFHLDDDVFILPRKTGQQKSNWQSSAAGYVHVLAGDMEIYDEGEWDTARLDYHLATLPRTEIGSFVNAAAEAAAYLNTPLEFRGRHVSPEELRATLSGYADELAASVAEPGTKDVRVMIESTYPR